jgi:hypothetical protein
MGISYIDSVIQDIDLQNEHLNNIVNNGLIQNPNPIVIPNPQRLAYFRRLISNLINNSIKCNRTISVNITPEQLDDIYIKQKGKCALSKRDLTFNYTNRVKKYNNSSNRIKTIKEINDFNISISRIDNNKGYTIDNIQLIACRINLMKNNLSNSKFIELCGCVVKNCNICKKYNK